MEDAHTAAELIATIRQNWRGTPEELEHRLHRYYLACGRAIGWLMPQEAGRKGIELAEQYLAGNLTADELDRENYEVKGAAFLIDYDTDPDGIAGWIKEIEAIPQDVLRERLWGIGPQTELSARELLRSAAYFADLAMVYPLLRPREREQLRNNYSWFLSPDLLQEIFSDVEPPK